MNTDSNLRPNELHPLRSGAYRDLARLAAEALAAGLIVSLVLALAIFIVATQAQAAEPNAAPGEGTLLLRGALDTPRVTAPLLLTDVRHRRQRNGRPRDSGAALRQSDRAVAGRRLRVSAAGEAPPSIISRCGSAQRRIEGQIRERGEARAAYEQAKSEGRKATPGRAGTAERVHDQRRAHRSGRRGRRHDRIPGNAALRQRRIPAALPDGRRAALRPWHDGGRRRVRHRLGREHRRRCPTRSASRRRFGVPTQGLVNPVTIAVDLHPGFPVANIDSPYHRIDVVESAQGHVHGAARRRADSGEPRLRARVDAGGRRRAGRRGVRRAQGRQDLCAGDGAAADAGCRADAPRLPREAVFIIDTSGSMEGASITQAKQALLDGARPAAARRSLQRDRVQFGHADAVRRADAGRPGDARAGADVRRAPCARAAAPR